MYLFIIFNFPVSFYCEFLTSCTKIKRQLDFYEMSGISWYESQST